MKKYFYTALVLLFSTPVMVAAQTGPRPPIPPRGGSGSGTLRTLIDRVGDLIGILIPILFGLGILVFVWGLVTALWKGREDGEARGEGLRYALWGIVIIFLGVSLAGAVYFIGDSLGIGQNQILKPPTVQFGP